MTAIDNIKNYFDKTTSSAPLAFFRIALGLLVFIGVARFWFKGWIHALYVEPKHHFTFYGFEFISPLGDFTYLLFVVCGAAAIFVALGFYYRISIVALFLSFTYIELIDKTTYLNHYYFISMICMLMIVLPAHAYFSVDAYRNRKLNSKTVPLWCVDSLKLFVCMIYLFAGVAKVNSDWLLHAQPLKIWLPAKNDVPVIGSLFNYAETAYVFSWMGCLYDLSIPFLLINRHTRSWAFVAVIIFHLLTAFLFPIGMFPYIMIVTALIFFPATVQIKALHWIGNTIGAATEFLSPHHGYAFDKSYSKLMIAIIAFFFLLQMALPFRHELYPGELFWTEQGYRFSWRVMLMEKAGYAQFTVQDHTGRKVVVNNSEFLTPLQEKMMATQPDMIVQYARLLSRHYEDRGFAHPEVYVDSYVSVNGRLGRPMVDPNTNLALVKDSFSNKTWILPFNEKISGF